MSGEELKVISRETIRPSSPTPPHLRIYSFSFIDHVISRQYVPIVLFYPNEGLECDATTPIKASDERSEMLKKSLSEVLAKYYPFAGRFRDEFSINCNDEGVTLLVTHIKRKLSEILQNPKQEFLNPLFADELQWKDMDSTASFLAIQINHFSCGGMAISVCMSHKVGDAFSLFNFVNDWATITRKSSEEEELMFPVLNGASIFPRGDLVFPEPTFVKDNNTVSKRFVFDASKIESLKAIVSRKVENPTRVQVVTALIFKSAVSALRSTFKSPNQTPLLRFALNLRTRMVPPLPEKSIGNMIWFVFVPSTIEAELHDLVSKTQEGLAEVCDKYAKNFGRKDLSFISESIKVATSMATDDNLVLFILSSWCRFPMYEVDFGWGKPIWVTTCRHPVKNTIFLMDTRDGNGIEALINMEEQDMAFFEGNVELLQYASLNPSIGPVDGL